MQSLTEQKEQKELLERLINQLFTEVISVWRDTDIKKSQAVRMLAARMEEYYLQVQQPQEIEGISQKITERLKEAGLSNTAHHVSDYLEDKYKRNKSMATNPLTGIISPNFVLAEVLRKDPQLERTKDEVQWFEDYCKRLETEREINRTVAKQRNIALDSDGDSLTKKEYESERTNIPNRQYKGAVHKAVWLLIDDLEAYTKDLKEMVDDIYRWYDPAKVPEAPLCNVIDEFRGSIKDVRCIIAPAKDLKYATSLHNWFHTLLKFLEHGKHAGGVMTSIPSATHTRMKKDGTLEKLLRALTREQVGDRVPYVEDLLLRIANSKIFFERVKSHLRATGQWDRNDKLRTLRAYFNTELVRIFADDGDFLHLISIMREELMDEEVSDRRIRARETLSDLA